MTDLNQLEHDLLTQVDAAGDEAALESVRVSALGKKGSVSELLKTLGAMTPEERKERGPAHQRPARQGAGRHRGQEGHARRGRPRSAARRRAHRRDAAGAGSARSPRPHPPDQPGDRGADGDLRRYGLLRRRGTGYRDGLSQLHGAQLPRGPSGPRDARHLLPRPRREGRAQGAAHAYLAGADPHDDVARRRRSGSSSRAGPIVTTRTRPTRRCSTRSKASSSTSRPTSRT